MNRKNFNNDTFIKLHSFSQLTYDEIEKAMNISRAEVQKLYKSCKNEISYMQGIRNKFNKKRFLKEFMFKDFNEFYDWYESQPKSCCYCGITQEDALETKVYDNLTRKTRGKSLEIERVVTFPKEKNLYTYKNCRLACHVCNNAKSDFIDVEDFKFIAKGINDFWSKKLNRKIDLPTEVYDTFSLKKEKIDK
ncbi:MAG: hypothetical protein ACNI3C_08860 [Candidatus Marinarcus sp.]|uniref:hypothetical protein n=1 Tax=Candidatus Marinarcus sp. TaxID=3100987 RepID=UPI003AFF74BF